MARARSFAILFFSGVLSILSAHAATLVVTSTADDGAGSLRRAIADAYAGGGPRDVITFALPAHSVITLTSAELLINRNVIIQGPGANMLTIKRSAAAGTPSFRIFAIPGNFTVDISGLTITNGKAPLGGGIFNGEGSVSLADCAISGNSADDSGGGVYNETGIASGRYMFIRRCLITDNSALTGGAAQGGGIYNTGIVSVFDSTISGNRAVYGGGVYSSYYRTSISGSTITSNIATSIGGGIFGESVAGTSAEIEDSIVAGNVITSASLCVDVAGNFQSNGYNLIGRVDCSTGFAAGVKNDRIGGGGSPPANADLGPLQDNGGPTFTHALGSSSLARFSGFANGRTIDQRGFPRLRTVAGDGSSIGAFEYHSGSIDIDRNRNFDALTDGLMIVRYLFGLSGDALINRAIGLGATRDTAAAILTYLDSIKVALDIDGNNRADALTDGLLLIRYLFGLRGPQLTNGAVAQDASRVTASQIENYIQSLHIHY